MSLRILSTGFFAGTLLINVLANSLPLNGLTTGEVSNLYPSLFTPAGITFSIWSVIYFLLIGFVILMWARSNDETIAAILPWFILSCVFNISWILAWHYLFAAVSVAIMLCLLAVLILIFKRLHPTKPTVKESIDLKKEIWLKLPFTIYLSWICVATIANISALLLSVGWDGGFITPESWTVVMMAVAALLALMISYNFKTPFFSVVLIWAIVGIYLRWRASDYNLIIYGSITIILILTFSILYIGRRQLSMRRQG